MPEESAAVRVLLASDSFLIGDGLAALLAGVPDLAVVGRARDYGQLVDLAATLAPDTVILSIRAPVISTMDTIVVARQLRVDHPDMGIVVIAEQANGFALELLRGGASRMAFLLDEQLPSTDAVIDAVRQLSQGRSVIDTAVADSLVTHGAASPLEPLTPRETDVLERIAHGLSNRAVADVLGISVKAVEKYVTVIFRKLGLVDHSLVDRRVNAALIFFRARSGPFTPLLGPEQHAAAGAPERGS
jgi:DNA-binding NarL/FixJ family response regulator